METFKEYIINVTVMTMVVSELIAKLKENKQNGKLTKELEEALNDVLRSRKELNTDYLTREFINDYAFYNLKKVVNISARLRNAQYEISQLKRKITLLENKICSEEKDAFYSDELLDPINEQFFELHVEPMQEEVVYNLELRQAIFEIINILTNEREKTVLRMYFGIGEDREYTFREIGKCLNITGARVQQIFRLALRRLRHPCRNKKIKPFIY